MTDGEEKATYRIEITLPTDGGVDPAEVARKIGKVLPEKLRDGLRIRISVGDNEMSDELIVPVPPSKSSEKRINDLEKKLEKVLHELHGLRKQMKESRSQSATPPSSRLEIVPGSRRRLLNIPIAPSPEKKPRSAPRARPVDPRDPDSPYYAPTVPLRKPAPTDPARP